MKRTIDTYTGKTFYYHIVEFDAQGRPWPYDKRNGGCLHPDRLMRKVRERLTKEGAEMRNDEQGYNGWSNYETWCVSMWLSNDEGTYNETLEMATRALKRPDYHTSADAAYPHAPDASTYEGHVILADALKEYVEEMPEVLAVTEGPASFVTDLLGAALSEVDWQEIAENLISEAK